MVRIKTTVGLITSICLKSSPIAQFRKFSYIMAEAKVRTNLGEIQGKVLDLHSGGKFLAFQGIPYAKPPVGLLRFKAPRAVEPWTGVLDATKEGNICTQRDVVSGQMIGKEDCLYLNVYTPALKPEKPFAVMVFIHGGAFLMGSGNTDFFGPSFLLEENIILVTINYRLGPLGFLTLDIPEVPGNAALRDQVEALYWIKENISCFGGDPDNVTLFGESAGAACVHYLMISPMAVGLFKRCIMQSGTSLMEWAFTNKGKERAFSLGKVLGSKNIEDSYDLLNFLQGVPAKTLMAATPKTNTPDEKRRGLPMPFSPTIEIEFPDQEAFLTDHPLHLVKSGKFNKMPMILGYNSSEGIVMISDAIKKLEQIDSDFERMIPRHINVELDTERSREIAAKIKKFYFQDKSVGKDTVNQLTDLMTDYHFATGVFQTLQAHSCVSDAPMYLYRFDYDGMLNFTKTMLGLKNLPGACHADELTYLFKLGLADIPIDDESWSVIKKFVKIWTNFAKTGNPTPDNDKDIGVLWPPVSKESLHFLSINKSLEVGRNPDEHRVKFWKDLFDQTNGHVLLPKL